MKLKDLNIKIDEMIGGVNRVNNYNSQYNNNELKVTSFQQVLKVSRAFVLTSYKKIDNSDKVINKLKTTSGYKATVASLREPLTTIQQKNLESNITNYYNELKGETLPTTNVEIYA